VTSAPSPFERRFALPSSQSRAQNRRGIREFMMLTAAVLAFALVQSGDIPQSLTGPFSLLREGAGLLTMVDMGSRAALGDRRAVGIVNIYDTPESDGMDRAFVWTEVDCAGERSRVLGTSFFAGSRFVSSRSGANAWFPLESEAYGRKVLAAACQGEFPGPAGNEAELSQLVGSWRANLRTSGR
jgi:hypothetical protein